MDDRPGANGVVPPEGGAAPLELERFMPYRLAVLSSRISLVLGRAYRARFGISLPEWRVLAVLGQDQPLSAGEVAARTRMDKVKVSRAVAAMERKGLLHRTTDAGDQRVARLALSAEGRACLRELAAFARAFERRLLEELGPALEAGLDEALARLSRRLDRLEGEAACPP